METWQLQDAKNKFSELVEHALSGKPQMVTRHGKPAVVVMSAAAYAKKTSTTKALQAKLPQTKQAKKPTAKNKKSRKPEMSFIEFLISAPKMPEEWFADGKDPFERVNPPSRDVDL